MITKHYYGKSYAIGVGKGFAPYLGTLRLRHSKKIIYIYEQRELNPYYVFLFINIQNKF